MKLSILSYNVQGLNDGDIILALRQYIQGLRPRPDIILLQEHKLRGLSPQQVGSRLWQQVHTWCVEALVGYNHGLDDQGT
jgi:endonuclease/exonuclease/phosphatase family metal-dependent hydrolase